jgi:hypothetical protein
MSSTREKKRNIGEIVKRIASACQFITPASGGIDSRRLESTVNGRLGSNYGFAPPQNAFQYVAQVRNREQFGYFKKKEMRLGSTQSKLSQVGRDENSFSGRN